MNKYLLGALVLMVAVVVLGLKRITSLDERWKTAEANVKAYSSLLSKEEKANVALQLSVDQLKYFNDSVLEALDETRKELGIKDKNLKALQAVKSGFTRVDTIRITQRDTLFKDPHLSLDTLIGDEWYNLKLGLKYPSMIAVKPYFKSEKHIIVSSKKETVNPPKKFFLFRWFQKRHVVLKIDVIEKNPYVDEQTSHYVEIIKK